MNRILLKGDRITVKLLVARRSYYNCNNSSVTKAAVRSACTALMFPTFETGGLVGPFTLGGRVKLVAAVGMADILVDDMIGEVLKLESEVGTFEVTTNGISGEVLKLELGEGTPDGIEGEINDGVLGGTEGALIGMLDGANVMTLEIIPSISKASPPTFPP